MRVLPPRKAHATPSLSLSLSFLSRPSAPPISFPPERLTPKAPSKPKPTRYASALHRLLPLALVALCCLTSLAPALHARSAAPQKAPAQDSTEAPLSDADLPPGWTGKMPESWKLSPRRSFDPNSLKRGSSESGLVSSFSGRGSKQPTSFWSSKSFETKRFEARDFVPFLYMSKDAKQVSAFSSKTSREASKSFSIPEQPFDTSEKRPFDRRSSSETKPFLAPSTPSFSSSSAAAESKRPFLGGSAQEEAALKQKFTPNSPPPNSGVSNLRVLTPEEIREILNKSK